MKKTKRNYKYLISVLFISFFFFHFSNAQEVAGVVSYTGTIDITNTNVSHSWPLAFSSADYYLAVEAWTEETIDGKTVRLQNGIYDFAKTADGFSLKLIEASGKLTYYAVEAVSQESTQTINYSSTPTHDWLNGNNGIITLSGDVSSYTLANVPDGGNGDILIIQDATGGYGINSIAHAGLNTQYLGGIPDTSTINTDANAFSQFSYKRFGNYLVINSGGAGNTDGGTSAPNYVLTVTESYLNDANSGNSGSVSPDTQQYADGTTVTVANDFTNSGANFSGFFWNSDGTNPVTSFDISQDTTVYAVYDYTEPASSPLLNGLISFWNFDETSGSLAADSHGNNVGTLINTPEKAQPGVLGTCYHFESGDQEYVEVPNSDFSFARTDAFSISAWVKFESLPSGAIFSKMDHHLGWPNYIGYRIWTESDGDLTFAIMSDAGYYSGGGLYARANANLTTGTWYYVVVTYDGSQSLSGIHTYINAVSQNWQSSRDDLSSGSILNSKNTVIGAHDGGALAHFYGLIDAVGIWNRALTSQEIQELYNSGTGKAYPFD